VGFLNTKHGSATDKDFRVEKRASNYSSIYPIIPSKIKIYIIIFLLLLGKITRMDSLYISKHLRVPHEEIIGLIEYFDRFVDHPEANTHEKGLLDGGKYFYKSISVALVMGICLKLDLIDMFDPILLNHRHQELVC
jgi:hypothetical protein